MSPDRLKEVAKTYLDSNPRYNVSLRDNTIGYIGALIRSVDQTINEFVRISFELFGVIDDGEQVFVDKAEFVAMFAGRY